MTRAAGTALVIRDAVPEEAAALTDLAMEAKARWGYPAEQLKHWRPELAISAASIGRRPAFVAVCDQIIVGFCTLLPGPSAWELDNLWVRPAFMGRGHGRTLLAHALEVAARGGATEVTIDADPHAEAFYLACGATRRGTLPAPIPGQPDRVRPQLAIAAAALARSA